MKNVSGDFQDKKAHYGDIINKMAHKITNN